MDTTIMLLLMPVLILQIILFIVAYLDLKPREKTNYLDKTKWFFIILLLNIIGPGLYFVLEGKSNDERD